MSTGVPLELVAEFLNTLDERTFGPHGQSARDEIATRPALGRWLAARGLAASGARVSPHDHRLVLHLRGSLRVLLAAGDDDELPDLSSQLPIVIRFTRQGPTLHPVTASNAQRFATRVLAACAAAAARGDWPLLKMCAAPDCHWIFIDRSRNHLARWCATQICGNRVKTRSYRARVRTGKAAS